MGRPSGFAKQIQDDYNSRRYHLPDDEYDPSWNWAGVVEDLSLFYRLGRTLADTAAWPNWYPQDEFRRIRDESCAPAGGC